MRHYIQPIKTFARSSFEANIWEVVVALISGMFAYLGYKANLAILLFPMATVSFICMVGLLTSVYHEIKELLNKS
jgi:Na+/H+ antiporter NhaC